MWQCHARLIARFTHSPPFSRSRQVISASDFVDRRPSDLSAARSPRINGAEIERVVSTAQDLGERHSTTMPSSSLTDQDDAIGPSMRQRPAFGWPLAYSGHSTCQMARHERAFGSLKAGPRRVEWYRYGDLRKVGMSDSEELQPETAHAKSSV